MTGSVCMSSRALPRIGHIFCMGWHSTVQSDSKVYSHLHGIAFKKVATFLCRLYHCASPFKLPTKHIQL